MSNDPVLIAYAVRRLHSGGVRYQRISCAYPHEVGEELTIIPEAMPLKGRQIILLELDESDDRRLLTRNCILAGNSAIKKPLNCEEEPAVTASPFIFLPSVNRSVTACV